MSEFAVRATRAWQVMIASYVGLILVFLISTFANPPETVQSGVMLVLSGLGIWLFKIFPLLFVIPGLVKRSHKAASWLAYLTMLYFVIGVMLVFTREAALWGWLIVALVFAIFISSLLFTRWQKRMDAGL